nr:DUF4440 domain-containing protein [Mammaliicoccus sp. Marseille-Q6498]
MKQQFYELECFHLKAENRHDKEKIMNLLHDDFKEIGKSGRIFNKSDFTNAELHTFNFEIDEFKADKIQKGIVLVTYRLNNKTDNIVTNRSTLWIRNNSEWKMRFHQGTIAT